MLQALQHTVGSRGNGDWKAMIFNPLNPIVHFWLHHTAHCAEKIVSARLRAGSASAERVGQGEVGGTGGGGGTPVGCCAHGGC